MAESPYVLENLSPATSYEFRFLAANDVGFGPWNSYISETTPMRNAPNVPKLLALSNNDLEYDLSPYNSQYELRWIAPPDNGEPIDFYEIKYCEVKVNLIFS